MTEHKARRKPSRRAAPDPVRPPTPAERKLIDHIDRTWTRERALSELKSGLQTAIEVELATIPIYLYTYYSIDRTPRGFPQTPVSRFADKAGAIIMSVAVEEMLHMSLSSNVLFSLGQMPQLYLRSPAPFPSNLPGHARLGPDSKPLALPLSRDLGAVPLLQWVEDRRKNLYPRQHLRSGATFVLLTRFVDASMRDTFLARRRATPAWSSRSPSPCARCWRKGNTYFSTTSNISAGARFLNLDQRRSLYGRPSMRPSGLNC